MLGLAPLSPARVKSGCALVPLFPGYCWWRGWLEVPVLLGFSLGVDMRRGCVPGGPVPGGDSPLFFVDEVMVVGAKECAIVQIRRSAV